VRIRVGSQIVTLSGGMHYDALKDALYYDLNTDSGRAWYAIYNGKSENKWATILSESEVVQEPAKSAPNPVLLTYRDEQGTLINIRATEVKINPLEGE